jgi:hypothetical protein
MVNTNNLKKNIKYKLSDLKIIVPTCDNYVHLLEGLMYTTRKFWSLNNEFIILGYKEPKFKLDNNWSFISLGVDNGPSKWSDDLLLFFNDFKDDYFINMIDDTLMTRESDVEKITRVFNYMQNNKLVKKVFLHGSLSDSNFNLLGPISLNPVFELNNEFYDVNQIANYRSSLQSSIWSIDYFLKLLKPNMTPWDFEQQHTKNDGVRILTTKLKHPTMYSHLYRKGNRLINQWYKSVFEETKLSDEDIIILKEMLKL